MKQVTDVFSRRLEKKGITRKQWVALYYLGKNGFLSQNELGNCMDIKESTVARLIDRMERDELVTRKKNESDRRVSVITLTKKGEEYREKLMPEGEMFSDQVMEGISDEDIATFINVMHKMISNAKKIQE
jgi:DNA-binding MarR family transcriptional regulator